MIGGVGEEARKVDELQVRWIWNPWMELADLAGGDELLAKLMPEQRKTKGWPSEQKEESGLAQG